MTRARRPHGSTPNRSPKTTIVSHPVSTPRPRRPIATSSSLKNSPPTPSVSVLLSQSLLTTDEWYKSSKTTKAYAAYVKSGKKFLESWEEEGSTDIISSNDPEDPSTFAGAFDEINSKTPIALRLLTAYKCDHQGKGFATAEGLRSAFKLYFERVHGCQGEFWKFDSARNEWNGNPVFDPEYKTYFESLKNRNKRTGTSTQALPMLPKDLKVVMRYLDSEDAIRELGETKCLYFKAFATTAFSLWTRNDELINLQCRHVQQNCVSPDGYKYHDIQLVFRKTNKDQNKGQHYNIPPDLSNPEIDCYSHLNGWFAHLSSLLGRELTGDDYIFPAIASTNLIKFGEPTSRSGVEVLLELVVEKSGVMNGRNGKFTTHCFRRGGAQYRFMWAERKWSLKAVKWWGGWSSSEHVGTIMRYLLDELTAYEEGFGDILLLDRASERRETFMGSQSSTATVSHTDLQIFREGLLQQLQDLLPTLSPTYFPQPCVRQDDIGPWKGAESSGPYRRPQSLSAPAQFQARSVSPRIPKTTSIDDALRFWEEGDVSLGLSRPLKMWATVYRPSEYRSEAQKLSMIHILRDEFVKRCNHDWKIFEERYPGLRYEYTKLVKAVREARIARGDIKRRRAHRP